jgi:hypothetical protein
VSANPLRRQPHHLDQRFHHARPPPGLRHDRHDDSQAHIPGLNIALLAFLALAAIQLFLAQSYGIQAFIQSQPDNGDFASASASSPTGSNDHNDWVQGKALSIWASIAWLSAGLALGTGTLAWGLPGRVVA